jgi:hypothetical protein
MDAATRDFHLNVAINDLGKGETDFDGKSSVASDRLKDVLRLVANDPRPVDPRTIRRIMDAYTDALASESI